MRNLIGLAAVAAAAWLAGGPAAAQDGGGDGRRVGTWKLVGVKSGGRAVSIEKEGVILKHVTPAHTVLLAYGPDGTAYRGSGGGYTARGDEVTEVAEYVFGRAVEDGAKGRAEVSRWRIDGDRLVVTWEAVEQTWERVGKK